MLKTEIQHKEIDVLNCIANLSQDEVFTQPKIANLILDQLPEDLWSNENATFLDPYCKTGVFLREITKRLDKGLSKKIQNREERINHIFEKQVFGIGTSELCALISRRTVYCARSANGVYSVADRVFNNEEGNIRFIDKRHVWDSKNQCKFCGASKKVYKRQEEKEKYAYPLLHNTNPERIFKMKFDVIIGNPPYQMKDGGNAASAVPIYQRFVEESIKLNPRFLCMIIPARWFSGGKGLEKFREKMIIDTRMKVLHDYLDHTDCFPDAEIKGGVCYFLWSRDYKGECDIFTHHSKDSKIDHMKRFLSNGGDTFIRYSPAVPIVENIKSFGGNSINKIISSRKPFDLPTNFDNYDEYGDIRIYAFKKNDGKIRKNRIKKNKNWIDKYKLFIPYAFGSGNSKEDKIKPILGKPGEI